MKHKTRIIIVFFLIQTLLGSMAYAAPIRRIDKDCLAPGLGLQSLEIEHSLVLMQKEHLQADIEKISAEIKELRALRSQLVSRVKKNIRKLDKLQKSEPVIIEVSSFKELLKEIVSGPQLTPAFESMLDSTEELDYYQAIIAAEIKNLENIKDQTSVIFRQTKKRLQEIEKEQAQKKASAAGKISTAVIPQITLPALKTEAVTESIESPKTNKAKAPASAEKTVPVRQEKAVIRTNTAEIIELLHSALIADIADMDEADPAGRLAQLIAYKNNLDWTDPLIIEQLRESIEEQDADLSPLFSLFKQETDPEALKLPSYDNKEYSILVRDKLTVQEQDQAFIRTKLEIFLKTPDLEKSRFAYKRGPVKGELYYAQSGNRILVFRFIPKQKVIVIVDVHTIQKGTAFLSRVLRYTPGKRDPADFDKQLVSEAQPFMVRPSTANWIIDEQSLAEAQTPDYKIRQMITQKFGYNIELALAWLKKSEQMAGVSSLTHILNNQQIAAISAIDISAFIESLESSRWIEDAQKAWAELEDQKNSFMPRQRDLESVFYLFDLAVADALSKTENETGRSRLLPVRTPGGALIYTKNKSPLLIPEEYFSGFTGLVQSTVTVLPITTKGNVLLCLPRRQTADIAKQRWTAVEAAHQIKETGHIESNLETAGRALQEQLLPRDPDRAKDLANRMILKELDQKQPFSELVEIGSYRGIPITRRLYHSGAVLAVISYYTQEELRHRLQAADFNTEKYQALQFFPWKTIVQEANERGAEIFYPALTRILLDETSKKTDTRQQRFLDRLSIANIELQPKTAREHLGEYMFRGNALHFSVWLKNHALQQAVDSGKTWLEFIVESAHRDYDQPIRPSAMPLTTEQILLQAI